MSRTKKSIEKDSQKPEVRLAAKRIGDGLEVLVCETEEEIDKLQQNMEELLWSDSQSLRPREETQIHKTRKGNTNRRAGGDAIS